ncbi:hypothetical protein BG57_14905 [Caballeronia grimmiae]|uniref:Uncharacterized protein n=1 Tax=Caballeronia grimmiae TaxID=1071679 RepID=A0A069NYW7_9BURK|nr:hypothetical protein BG57_14905 [Caballeronia grimmiae]
MPVEHEDFEKNAAGIVDGRAKAETCHCWQRLVGEAMHAHDEDARRGRALVRDRQIERGKAEIAAELRAMHDVTANDIRTPEREMRGVEIARDERRPHRRRRNARAVRMRNGGHLLDFEAVLVAGRLQRGEVAGAFRAIAEVVADHDPARVKAIDDDVLHERIRRLARECVIEMLDHHAIDAIRAQRFELVAQHRDARRRACRIEELARMRLEGHHADRQPARVGGGTHARKQRLVAAMDTVEVADGQCAGRPALGIGEAAEDSHDRLGRWEG